MQNNFIQLFAQYAAPQNGAKFGIDTCKKFIVFVSDAIDGFSEALKDGKITLFEALGLTPTVISGTRLLSNFDTLLQELINIDDDETAELIAQLKELPAFRSDTSQDIIAKINATVGIIVHLLTIFDFAKRFKSGKPDTDDNGFVNKP